MAELGTAATGLPKRPIQPDLEDADRITSKLVDRFLDFTRWPPSKKTTLISASYMLIIGALGVLAYLLLREMPQLISWARLAPLVPLYMVAMAVVTLVSLAVWRSGREGRWTPYLLVLVSTPFMVWLYHLYGTLSSPVLASYPMLILVPMLFFDTRVGWVTFFVGTALVLPVVVFELHGSSQYAPILVDRTIDAQRNSLWFAYIFAYVQASLLVTLFLIHLTVSSRERQQLRLERTRAELAQANDRMSAANDLIRHYVPAQVAESILRGDQRQHLRPERRRMTLFFSDIEGFTAASDQLEPEDLSELLNDYLSEMAGIADAFGATVNQFVGDGIMIFFGAPEATDDRGHALRAIRMALAMQRRMRELRERWYREGIEKPFRIRIGIHTGVASVGDFGSAGRTTYSAIGRETNVTARIQSHCEPGKILITHSTWALVRDEIDCVEKGEIELKGIHYPVRVYEVTGESRSPRSAPQGAAPR